MTKKEFVAMSLPYGLKVLIPESNQKYCRRTVIGTVGVVFDDGSINCYDTVNACPRWYKPILYTCDFGVSDLYGYELIHAIKKHYDIEKSNRIKYKAMTTYKIIEGIIKGKTKKCIFIKIDRDGIIEYRGVNIRERKWGDKYGPYHSIIQKAGSMKCYDCGRTSYQVDEIRTVYEEVDGKQVALGYRNIDIQYEESKYKR